LLSSFEEANQAVRQMQMEFAPVLSDHMPWLFGGGGGDSDNVVPTLGSDLGTIVEAASEGDDEACTESEIADATDAETETEESLSHDGRPGKKSVKSMLTLFNNFYLCVFSSAVLMPLFACFYYVIWFGL
jgi:hypothetical protein